MVNFAKKVTLNQLSLPDGKAVDLVTGKAVQLEGAGCFRRGSKAFSDRLNERFLRPQMQISFWGLFAEHVVAKKLRNDDQGCSVCGYCCGRFFVRKEIFPFKSIVVKKLQRWR